MELDDTRFISLSGGSERHESKDQGGEIVFHASDHVL